jgi:hypothetical protein
MHTMKHFLRITVTGALAVAMGACSSQNDSVTSPTANFQITAEDSALIAVRGSADETVSDVNMFNGVATTMGWSLVNVNSGVSFSLTPSGSPSFAWGVGSGCTLNPADGRFNCAPTTNTNGLIVTRSIAFYDASGNLMDQFDSTTASVNVQATDVGVMATVFGADTVNRARNVTATGLLGHNTTRIWNGTASGTSGAYWADSAAVRTADVADNTTFTNIVVALPRASNPYPVSGTISRMVTGSGVVTKGDSTRAITISRNVTITFNGTEFVPMTVGSETYTLDLATGKTTPD